MLNRHQNSSKARRKLRALVRRMFAGVSPEKTVRIKFDDKDFSLRCFRNDHVTSQLETKGTFYEETLLRYIVQSFGRGGHYVDFGAYIGTHSVFFSNICEATRITAVEPTSASFRLLKQNLSNNRANCDVKLFNCAVGAESGRAQKKPASASWTDLHNHGATRLSLKNRGPIDVIRGDEVLNSPPKLIKIDTEGWEMSVLMGCERTLSRHHPVIVVEAQEDTFEDVKGFLESLGYECGRRFNATPTYVFTTNTQ